MLIKSIEERIMEDFMIVLEKITDSLDSGVKVLRKVKQYLGE